MTTQQHSNPIRQELLELLTRIVKPGGLKYKSESLLRCMVDVSVGNLRDLARDAHREGAEEVFSIITKLDPNNPHAEAYAARLKEIWTNNHKYNSEGVGDGRDKGKN